MTANEILQRCIDAVGERAVLDALESLLSRASDAVLTIVPNRGLHPIRQIHARGDVFIASEGSLDFSSAESAQEAIGAVLVRVAEKLRSRPWERVYLVPFGPSVLSAQVKLLVYRVLHMETIDVLHGGGDVYYDIQINQRLLVSLPSETSKGSTPTDSPPRGLTPG